MSPQREGGVRRDAGSRRKEPPREGDRDKTSYDPKMCVFANRSDPVLREKWIM